ncbi:MAG: conjugal transfer protein TraX [Oscillospiraceae bacterium]|nr:conjugal transfer protein TraX [Oscillospiraceae bacterium]MBQ9250897.1 conjugal transfer protein TraX [Oscillospiraceae bacterium]
MEEQRNWRTGVTAAALKGTALVSMLIDHIGYVLLPALILYGRSHLLPWDGETLRSVYWTLRSLGRPAFPLYLFLLLEGFQHTRSRGKYLLRLSLFALLSEIPFDLALNQTLLEFAYQNVFFTLAIGFAALMGIDALRRAPGSRVLRGAGLLLIFAAAPALAWLLRTDYDAVGVAALELLYAATWLRERRGDETPVGRVLCWCAMLPALLLSSRREWWSLLALPLVILYNGKKGRQPSRWFFYGFYPAHLLLLAALRALLFR